MKKIVEAIILFILFVVGAFIVGLIEHILQTLMGDVAMGILVGILMFIFCLFIV